MEYLKRSPRLVDYPTVPVLVHLDDTDATASWRTPPEDLDVLARLLRVRWAVDLAADERNTVAPRWYGPTHPDPDRRNGAAMAVSHQQRLADDLRAEDLGHLPSPAVWCNPPYSSWGGFADVLARNWHSYRQAAALLVFARTDTKAWHRAATTSTAMLFRRGRMHFLTLEGVPGGSAPAPSAVVWWGPPVTARHDDWLVVRP